jgi:hypothetical protein
MLWALGGILLFFWIIGLSFHVMGSYIHLLLLFAVATFLIRFIRGNTV